LTAVCL